jgi:hypothetical protein
MHLIMPQDAHIKERNDVIEIVLHENFGLARFLEMGDKPGKIQRTRHEIVLTRENLERFRGQWRRVIQVTSLPQFYDLESRVA